MNNNLTSNVKILISAYNSGKSVSYTELTNLRWWSRHLKRKDVSTLSSLGYNVEYYDDLYQTELITEVRLVKK